MDSFDTLRPYLSDYLRNRGIRDLKKRFRCLNPEHTDTHPSMGYDPKREKVHCFACGADYDLFDLIALEENLSSPGEALASAREKYGRDAAGTAGTRQMGKTGYTETCFLARGKTDYFEKRGLSPETVTRFRLGYDEKNGCAVLPCADGHYIRRSVKEKRYLNEKGKPSPLFQPELLASDGGAPVFLVEGMFDALSAEELGYRACALNGAGNREKAAELLRSQSRKKTGPVLLLPDNDAAGDAWARALTDEFPWLYRCPAVPYGKDLNELLCHDPRQAAEFLKSCTEAGLAFQPPSYADESAAGRLRSFEEYITLSTTRPALETGFTALDGALDGGLYDGLYVLGAVSSLGKTAFCMQIADHLAAAGRDVLVFSLEMSAFELMARSISRESFLCDASAGRRLAKTVRGVLDGRRRKGYTAEETEHLEKATEIYRGYAGRLYLREGDHETGAAEIEAAVARHIDETGNRPVVLIDYLQILAPADVHFTDKQNLDRNVCALKKLSRQYGLTVLAVSSFNRENYNAEATMAAFKESGGIDYSADVLLGLQAKGAGSRSFNLEEEKKKDPRELELKIIKNRTGALGDPVALRYYPAFSCFEEARTGKPDRLT